MLLRSHTAYVRQGGVLLGAYICSPWGCPHGCMLGSPARVRHLRVSSLEFTCNVACGVRACALASTYGICSPRRVSSRVYIHVHRLRVSSRGACGGWLSTSDVHICIYVFILYIALCESEQHTTPQPEFSSSVCSCDHIRHMFARGVSSWVHTCSPLTGVLSRVHVGLV